MKKKEFCEEIINQINYFLGEENKNIKLNDHYNEIVNQLILTLVSYSNNREEFDKYTLKIKNKLAYFNITLNYVLNFFEDISLN